MTAYTIPSLPSLPAATGGDPRATLLAYYSGGNGTGVVPANFLNRQSTLSEIRANGAAVGQPIPIAYGQVQIGGQIFAIDYTDGTWTVGAAFCLGEIDGYVELLINGETIVGPLWDITTGQIESVSVNYYTGTTSQTADPLLAAAITGYADTLIHSTPLGNVGIAYVVVQYRNCHYSNWPTFVAELKGKKVYNPATATTIYSANPALMLGDLLRSTVYGGGYTVDTTALDAAMDYCDEAVDTETRRVCGIVIDSVQDTDSWIEILRAYASCWIVKRGGTVYLVPDKATASSATLDESGIIEGTLRITKQDSSNLPTVVRIQYTDTSGTEWRQKDACAKRSGVDAGTTPWRESVVNMAGITSYSQAYREAVERLNKLWLSDLAVEFETFDEALQYEAGDVIAVTHFLGLTSKALRITEDPEQVRPGRWRIRAAEYDAAAYSNAVQADPSTPDSNLPDVGPPSAVTGLTLTEDNIQTQNGDYASRIRIAWTASTSAFVTAYQVTVTKGAAVVYSAETRDTSATTPPVEELVQHQVEVRALTPLYVGTAASDTITVVGKTAVPDGPASLSGYEVASEVRLSWPADVSDFDIRRYELRYGITAGSWATATVLDQIDGLTYTTQAIPEGEWTFYVNSIDSIGQYGTTPATCVIDVSLSDRAYLAHEETCTTGSTTLMVGKTEARGSSTTTYYSDGADTWTSLFGAAAMSTFTNSLASYQTAGGTSEWISAAVDVGSSMTGDWLGTVTYTDHNGTATAQLGLSTDNVTYTWGALSRKGTARYAKIRVQSTGIFSVQVPGPAVQLRVIARETSVSGTSSSSAAVTVDIGIAASEFKSISITPISATQYTWHVSNLDTSGATATFDLDIRTMAGARAAVAFIGGIRTV